MGTFDLSLPFSQANHIAIWNLRFRNAAILRFHSAIFCDFSAEPAVRVAILNLRFENAAIAIAIFWDAKRTSRPKNFHPIPRSAENKVSCADVLDPKAWTSMTRASEKLYAGKLGAEFSFSKEGQGALKGTNLRDKPSPNADFCRFSLILQFLSFS